jgi:TolB-like protein
MSGDQEQQYFADANTEDIITEISKIHGLMVISRNSTFTYKGKAVKAMSAAIWASVICWKAVSARPVSGCGSRRS